MTTDLRRAGGYTSVSRSSCELLYFYACCRPTPSHLFDGERFRSAISASTLDHGCISAFRTIHRHRDSLSRRGFRQGASPRRGHRHPDRGASAACINAVYERLIDRLLRRCFVERSGQFTPSGVIDADALFGMLPI